MFPAHRHYVASSLLLQDETRIVGHAERHSYNSISVTAKHQSKADCVRTDDDTWSAVDYKMKPRMLGHGLSQNQLFG